MRRTRIAANIFFLSPGGVVKVYSVVGRSGDQSMASKTDDEGIGIAPSEGLGSFEFVFDDDDVVQFLTGRLRVPTTSR